MTLNKIFIPEQFTSQKAIKEINIDNLQNVVAFVGKNGSGKSRILDLIELYAFNHFSLTDFLEDKITYLPEKLKILQEKNALNNDYLIPRSKLRDLEKLPPNQQDQAEKVKLLNNLERVLTIVAPNEINKQEYKNQYERQFIQLEREFTSLSNETRNTHLKRIRNSQIRELKTSLEKTANQNLNFEKLLTLSQEVGYDEMDALINSSMVYIQNIPNLLSKNAYYSLKNKEEEEEKEIYKKFESLKKYILAFLDCKLDWKENDSPVGETGITFRGTWKLDGKPFNYGQLSDGQRTLFAYALIFFLLEQNEKLNLKESIIIIDEPELNLHPDAEIDLIEKLRDFIGEKGQLIIATHSINILSHLNYDEIIVVKDSAIEKRTSLTPKSSLQELMNPEQKLAKLSEFIDSLESWTYSNFMAQCFQNPDVIESAKPDDPQVKAFINAIKDKLNKDSQFLLDFGAGKGRLMEQIKLDYDFISKINYSALEIEKEYHQRLTKLGAITVYNSHDTIPKKTFDFIVLCNVLHEIKIEEWEQTLNNIIAGLKEDGYLIIIEAKYLSKGEKIGKTGFLLLGLDEMKKLFNLIEDTSSFTLPDDDKKIISAIFPKNKLQPIAEKNIINCLTSLEINTLKEIKKLRNEAEATKDKSKIGLHSAFLAQQHINAKIALEIISEKEKIKMN